ncbi:density-regulated protein homolog isoform X1 [Saccostrea echinata]|uniref:density-regulated protein homolog isoform X1 n=1 Tax=Saccostrea echinata TaxID=191078 RepID=UPI002A7EC3BC|nr:density-regulated protein homolog isoform X1 [Saccostrea echinata]
MAEVQERQFFEIEGPRPDVSYPMKVTYCGECTMPLEYCEYYPNYEKCKAWLEKNLPDEFSKLMSDKPADEGDGDTDKKRQKRGGKGQIKTKKKSEPKGIRLGTAKRGKKKHITVVIGLGTYDIDLKEASKVFSSKFSCGSSVTGDDEIVIQGDVSDDLFEFLPEKWPQIDEDDIDDVGEMKK